MNKDKIALRYMIKAALECPEFIEGHGDGKYLFSNMVAKFTLADDHYRFTEGALKVFIENGGDVNKVYSRSSLYGKKSPFIYEHAIPARVVRDMIIENPDKVDEILDNVGEVFITLRTEDEILRKNGYQSNMSEGWEFGDSHTDRYDECNIKISNTVLEMKGAIKR